MGSVSRADCKVAAAIMFCFSFFFLMRLLEFKRTQGSFQRTGLRPVVWLPLLLFSILHTVERPLLSDRSSMRIYIHLRAFHFYSAKVNFEGQHVPVRDDRGTI